MRGEQAIFNLEIKKKSGLSINPDIHHSKVFSSGIPKNFAVEQFSFNFHNQSVIAKLYISVISRCNFCFLSLILFKNTYFRIRQKPKNFKKMTFFWPRWVRSNIFNKKTSCGMWNVECTD